MALSADQKAMLGLLLERGQTYADIGELLGSSEDEVRSRARWALAELGGADPDRTVGLTDYLLGQADPIGRADAVRHLRDDDSDRELAESIVAALADLAPGAELPRLPGEARTAPHLRAPRRRGRSPEAAGDEESGAARPRSSLSARQTRLIVALGSAAVIIAVVVAAAAGAFEGGGSSSTTASAPSTTSTTSPTTGTGTTTQPAGNTGNQTLTPVPLKALGGSPGSGLATFGLATQNTPFLDVRTRGLTTAPTGQVYSVWLTLNPATHEGYPIAPLLQAHDRFNIPSVVLPVLPKMKSVDIVVSPANVLRKEIRGVLAAKKPKLILQEPGNVALRGVIPRKTRG